MQGFLDQYGLMLGLIGLSLAALLAIAVVMLSLRIRSMSRRWEQMMRGSNGGTIETMLKSHLEATAKTTNRLDAVETRLDVAEAKLETSKRYVGLVRYDAFDDVGGAQSFSLAVYDERGDGAVVTSMVGRADCRVYAKEIREGKSERELSKEEQQAIESAVRPRTTGTAKAAR